MAKSSDALAPGKSGARAPKARPRRQYEQPRPPKGGHRASIRGGARHPSAKDRKMRERGEPPLD
ncbi:MAG TPA: hypothetical protein VIL20_29415 [Sandaracinaceae bacterium]